MNKSSWEIEFDQRFEEFRRIESEAISNTLRNGSDGSYKSFSLLSDMETCYAAKAYSACVVLACIAIESSFGKEMGNKKNLKSMIKKSGYEEDLDWLRELRNKIVHNEECEFVNYQNVDKSETDMDSICKKAFKMVHTIYLSPIRMA